MATPIGNLEDMTSRAVRILGEVDLIAAEDTRHTRHLLNHFGISKPLVSYFQHNQVAREDELLAALGRGEDIALVSDAGMPGISDPGTELARAAIREGIQVIPIPGPTALIAGLSASGMPTERFVFEGFLPRSGKERKNRLKIVAAEERTVVLYEAPHRIRETLSDLRQTLGEDRRITVARELTKIYEEFWRGTIGEADEEFRRREPKGEFALIIEGCTTKAVEAPSWSELVGMVEDRIREDIPASEAIRQIAKDFEVSRRLLYEAYQGKKR